MTHVDHDNNNNNDFYIPLVIIIIIIIIRGLFMYVILKRVVSVLQNVYVYFQRCMTKTSSCLPNEATERTQSIGNSRSCSRGVAVMSAEVIVVSRLVTVVATGR